MAKVAAALFRNGYSVLAPMEDFTGYDLVAEKDGKFYRIQVKTTTKQEENKLYYRFVTARGFDKTGKYAKNKVDYIVCYAMDESELFWLFKTSQCQQATKKCYPKTGSSWRIINDL